MPNKYDLVFEGGGAKGIGFVGALQELTNQGHGHARLVGTSAGAITATLLGAGYSPDELVVATSEIDKQTGKPVFAGFMDPPKLPDFTEQVIANSETSRLLNMAPFPALLRSTITSTALNTLLQLELYRELFSFVECGGLYSGNAFLDWFRQKLKAKNIAPDITWRDFNAQTGQDVSVVTSDLDDCEMVVLNHRTAPGIPVAESVRMSMSIPFVWREMIWQDKWGTYLGRDKTGHKFVDGGVLSNFALRLVAETDDDIRAWMGNADLTANPSIGLLLDETKEVPGVPPTPPKSIHRFQTATRVTRLLDCMQSSTDTQAMRNHPDKVCRIAVKGFGTTEFGMAKDRMDLLIESGRSAMREFLSRPSASAAAATK